MNLKLKYGSLTLVVVGSLFFLSFSIFLLNFENIEILYVWWLILLAFLPLFVLSLRIDLIYVKVISGFTLVVLSVSTPFFYIYQEDFVWDKPFGFNLNDAIPIIFNIFFFLFFFILFSKFFSGKIVSLKRAAERSEKLSAKKTDGYIFLRQSFNSRAPIKRYGPEVLVLIFLLFLIPLNFWMFSQGIGIVGIQPPPLPYRLAGILHYFTKYIAPLILFYFYFLSRSSLITTLLLVAYAFALGISSLSRFSFLFVMLPVVYIAISSKKIVPLLISGILIFVGFFFITYTRNFVYVISDNLVGGNFVDGLFEIIYISANSLFSDEFKIEALLNIPLDMINRVESFQNLVMAQSYDIYRVTTPLKLIANSFSIHFFGIDPDLHHLEWQGNILPLGFFNGGGLLSNVVILGGAGLAWVFIYSFVITIILFSFEFFSFHLIHQYKFSTSISWLITIFFTFIFFMAGSGTNFIVLMYALVLIFGLLPPLKLNK